MNQAPDSSMNHLQSTWLVMYLNRVQQLNDRHVLPRFSIVISKIIDVDCTHRVLIMGTTVGKDQEAPSVHVCCLLSGKDDACTEGVREI